MEKLKAQVQHLHGLQQADRAKCEATWKIGLEQEAKRKVVIEACLRSFYRGWIFELQGGPSMVIFNHGVAVEDKGEEVRRGAIH